MKTKIKGKLLALALIFALVVQGFVTAAPLYVYADEPATKAEAAQEDSAAKDDAAKNDAAHSADGDTKDASVDKPANPKPDAKQDEKKADDTKKEASSDNAAKSDAKQSAGSDAKKDTGVSSDDAKKASAAKTDNASDRLVTKVESKTTTVTKKAANDVVPNESDQLATPTNLHWRGISVPWMAEWDPIEDLKTPASERTVEEYEVILYYGSSADNLTQVWTDSVYDGAVDISSELSANGEGYYAFDVKAKATAASGKQDSEYAKSDPVFFGKLKVKVQTLDEDGTTDISNRETGGTAFLQAGTGGYSMYDGESAFLPSSMAATLTASADRGYIFKEMKFSPEPTNLSVSGKKATFNLDKSSTATPVFQKSSARVPIIIEFGDKHATLAGKVLAQIEAEAAYTASLKGSTLTIQWPLADTASSPADYVSEIVLDINEPTWDGSDEGEQYENSVGLKPYDQYADMKEWNDERWSLDEVDIAEDLKLYVHWAKPAETASFTVEPLVCGTEVTEGSPYPDVTADAESQCESGMQALWYKSDDPAQINGGPDDWFAGTVKGGDKSYVGFLLAPSFGYFIDDDNPPTLTVNGEDVELKTIAPYGPDGPSYYVVMATLDVEHDLGEWEAKEGDPTKEVQKCKHCGEVINERDLITLTLIPSTMDGSEIGDPVVLTIPKGESLFLYLNAEAGRHKALLEQLKNMNEGYFPYNGNVFVTDKPYSEYSSEDDVDDADDEFFFKALTENTTFYVPMDKFIEELDVTVERPMAGTQVAVQTDDGIVQDGAKGLPTTTISDDKVAIHCELPYWVTDDITKDDYDKAFNGTIQARKDYKVLIQLESKLGWAFKKLDDPAYATINGKAVDRVLYSGHYFHDILGTVPSDFTYNLYVGGVHVTDSNKDDVLGDGTVKFDPENVKLTLNNANIEISRREDGDDGNEYGIRSNLGDGMAEFRDKPLTIELIGTNTISDSNNDEGTTNKYGIFVASSGPVTYTGGGTLNVNMKDANTAGRYLGLEHHQSITVDGVNINIDIDGTSNGINGIYMLYTNTLKLANDANVVIDVAKGYAFDNDVHTNNNDLDVTKGCTFEAVSGGTNGALHGSGWIQLTDTTKDLGVMVNKEATASGRKLWDGETNLRDYQYVRIPGIPSVTVNYDLGKGHEELAQADALKAAINKRYAMEVTGVEGSVVKIKVPELSDGNTKNTVARLLLTLRAALNESVGHDPTYGPYWVYDHDEWNFNNALKTIDHYSNYDEIIQEREKAESDGDMPVEDQTIYALWAKPVKEVSIDAESPVDGTKVTADPRDPEDPEMGLDPKTQKPQPVVSTNTEHVKLYTEEGWKELYWVDPTDKDKSGFEILPPCYTGTMEGGKDYMLFVNFEADFGYYLPKDVKFTTSNGTVEEGISTGTNRYGYAFITVTAEHVVTYDCTKGDNQIWTKGSGKDGVFTFKRTDTGTSKDETWKHWQNGDKVIEIDGKEVDESNYLTNEGSLVVTLKADYLEQLATGRHTITAHFDDSKADATFLIQEAATLTLKWTSIDGANPVDDYVVQIPKGTTFEDYFADEIYDTAAAHFAKKGYTIYGGYFFPLADPLSSYKRWDDVLSDGTMYQDAAIEKDTTYYIPMAKDVEKVALTHTKPLCGAKVTTDLTKDPVVQTNAPKVAIAKGSQMQFVENGEFEAIWVSNETEPLDGVTLKGGTAYSAYVMLEPVFGYMINPDNLPTVTVANADAGSVDASGLPFGLISFKSTPEHDWDNGKVTRKPTIYARGIRTYTCRHCGETRTEWIPKLTAGKKTTRTTARTASSTKTKITSVKTGDETAVLSLALVMLAAILAAFVFMRRRRAK